MGCQNCKTSEGVYCYIDINQNQFSKDRIHLVSSNERVIWLKSLNILTTPDEGFQRKYNDHLYQCHHPAIKQIKKDIVRSFPNSQFFTSEKNLSRFQTLLKKFATYFPKIGYTQGLNFVSGYLLMAGFNDSEAFESLIRICLHEKLMMIGMYEDQFPLNRFYCALFWNLLDVKMPKVAKKIKQAQVPDEIWIFQWFISFFLYSFPVYFVKAMWDFIICKKEFSMVLLALGLVKCLKKDILALIHPDEIDFFQFFDNLKEIQFCEERIDLRKAINYANSITKHQINKAIALVDLPNNVYCNYFSAKQPQQKQIFNTLMKKNQRQRERYIKNPQALDYYRDINSIQHLQKLILQKSQLYRSKTESKYSSLFRTSNFTIDFTGNASTISKYHSKESEQFQRFNQLIIKPREEYQKQQSEKKATIKGYHQLQNIQIPDINPTSLGSPQTQTQSRGTPINQLSIYGKKPMYFQK